MAEYLMGIDMGIDVGAGRVRTGLFDGDGNPVAPSSVEFGTSRPRPGWAEG
jgi:sugar (pentulose or hexulose) kinase